MKGFTPEQAEFLLQVFLPSLKNESRVTQKVLEAIPADKSDYRPDPASKTALELAWHIATADSKKNPADIAEQYAEASQKDFQRLTELKGEQLVKMIDFRGVLQLPAVMYVGIGLNHSIHHRGQLSAYLRAMGGKVPSIYGDSYDTAQAKKEAQG